MCNQDGVAAARLLAVATPAGAAIARLLPGFGGGRVVGFRFGAPAGWTMPRRAMPRGTIARWVPWGVIDPIGSVIIPFFHLFLQPVGFAPGRLGLASGLLGVPFRFFQTLGIFFDRSPGLGR